MSVWEALKPLVLLLAAGVVLVALLIYYNKLKKKLIAKNPELQLQQQRIEEDGLMTDPLADLFTYQNDDPQ